MKLDKLREITGSPLASKQSRIPTDGDCPNYSSSFHNLSSSTCNACPEYSVDDFAYQKNWNWTLHSSIR